MERVETELGKSLELETNRIYEPEQKTVGWEKIQRFLQTGRVRETILV